MIAIDTSALVAIVLGETTGTRCLEALSGDPRLIMSAGTLAEALLVARRRGKGERMDGLVAGLAVEIENVTPEFARRVADAHVRWGRGSSANVLNFGDCFAYALAKERRCPLLFVGDDFGQTDIESVL